MQWHMVFIPSIIQALLLTSSFNLSFLWQENEPPFCTLCLVHAIKELVIPAVGQWVLDLTALQVIKICTETTILVTLCHSYWSNMCPSCWVMSLCLLYYYIQYKQISNKNTYIHELTGHKRSRHCKIHIMWHAGNCWHSTTHGITPHETVVILITAVWVQNSHKNIFCYTHKLDLFRVGKAYTGHYSERQFVPLKLNCKPVKYLSIPRPSLSATRLSQSAIMFTRMPTVVHRSSWSSKSKNFSNRFHAPLSTRKSRASFDLVRFP